jgi:hypothetical protein
LPTDKDVVFIDPGLNTDEIFGEVDLPCNMELRMNNSYTAKITSRKEVKETKEGARSTSQEKKSFS